MRSCRHRSVLTAVVCLLAVLPAVRADEKPYAFRPRLECVHRSDLRDATQQPAADEFAFADGATVGIPAGSGDVLKGAAADFVAYFKESMNVKASVVAAAEGDCRSAAASAAPVPSVAVALDPSLGKGVHTVKVMKDGVLVTAVDERQAAQALYHLEDLMNLRRAPFLKVGDERREALFSPRMTHSAWGMDVFPDRYLRKIAHTGMDAIIICINEEDKTCGSPKGQDVSDVIRRAAKCGLDTYLYWKDNFDLRSFVHPDDPKAAEGYDAVYGRITGRYPDAKGVIFVGESAQFPSKDPHVLPAKGFFRGNDFPGDKRPMPGWYPCEDYPKWVKGVSAAIRRRNPKADVVFWTYNWGADESMEAPRLKMIDGLQKDVSLLATYEMFEKFDLPNGHHTQCDDYTLAFPGPGKYFVADAKQAKKNGLPLYAMSCTGGRTWDHGAVPYLPVPQLWKKRWDGLVKAHDEWGLTGIMEGHHNGAEPSFVNELEKEAFTRGGLPFEEHLRKICARDGFADRADKMVRAFEKWSEAQQLVPPTHVNEYGMFRIGPAYPFNALGKRLFGSLGDDLDKSDFPISKDALYGLGIVRLNYADDQVRQWVEGLDYFPRLMTDEREAKLEIEAIEKAANLSAEGLALYREATRGIVGDARGNEAWRRGALGDFLTRTYRTAVNVKKAKLLEDKVLSDKTDAKAKAEARAEILKLAREEYANAEGAIDAVRCNSMLGYEPSMEYVGGEEQIRWKLRKMLELYGKSIFQNEGAKK